MRYLTLSADYTQSALRDDTLGHVVPEEIGLPWELGDKIRNWSDRYRSVIPLSPDKRAEAGTAELIASLDEEGLSLATGIVDVLEDVKVRYFSEGLLRYVT